MRIAHVLTRLLRAGSEENTIWTCLSQVRRGHTVYIIHGADYDRKYYQELHPSIELIEIENLVHRIDPKRDLLATGSLWRLFKALKLDVVHTHQSKAGIIGRIAAHLAGVPIIVHGVHILPFLNAPPTTSFIYTAAERLCGSVTDLFIHVSQQMHHECLIRGIGSKADHIVAESGMDIGRFQNASPAADTEALLKAPDGSSERPFVILSIAALERRKGHRRFLPIFKKIVDNRPNTILLLVGEGEERSSIEQDIGELGLSRHVRLLGFRTDPERLLAISDVSIICSDREGLPRVAVQSALAGVPIVSTELPGIEAVVRQGETGFVTALASMEEALLRLMDEPELRRHMRATALRGDYSRWDIGEMAAKIEAAYSVQVQKRRPPAVQTAVTAEPGG